MNAVSHLPFLTLVIDTLNGWLGYLPTAEWEYGGCDLETLSPFTPLAARDITESVVGYLKNRMQNLQPAIILKARK